MKPTNFIYLALLVCVLFSCKKKHDATPQIIRPSWTLDSKIKTVDIHYYFPSSYPNHYRHYDIIYNDKGLVDSMYGKLDTSTFQYKFLYNGNNYKAIYRWGAGPGDTAYIHINDTGLITSVSHGGTYLLQYDDFKTNYKITDGDLQPCTWNADHDLSFMGYFYSYNYSTDRNSQTGDGMRIEDFLTYGRSYVFCEHLVSNDTDRFNPNNVISSYSYKFDVDGRITEMKIIQQQHGKPLDSTFYTYTY